MRLSGGDVFHKIAPGYCDGMRVDEDGNLWTSAGDGVHCIEPGRRLLGKCWCRIGVEPHLRRADKNRLFIGGSHTLYAIFLNRRGVQWP